MERNADLDERDRSDVVQNGRFLSNGRRERPEGVRDERVPVVQRRADRDVGRRDGRGAVRRVLQGERVERVRRESVHEDGVQRGVRHDRVLEDVRGHRQRGQRAGPVRRGARVVLDERALQTVRSQDGRVRQTVHRVFPPVLVAVRRRGVFVHDHAGVSERRREGGGGKNPGRRPRPSRRRRQDQRVELHVSDHDGNVQRALHDHLRGREHGVRVRRARAVHGRPVPVRAVESDIDPVRNRTGRVRRRRTCGRKR